MAIKRKEAPIDNMKNEVKAKSSSRKKAETKPLPPIAMLYSPPKKRTQSSEKKNEPFFDVKENLITRLIVKYDVGFSNAIYVRGCGANLSWDKGAMLTNISHNEWVWEATEPFSSCEFKVLLNDTLFETGENHTLFAGSTLQHTPKF